MKNIFGNSSLILWALVFFLFLSIFVIIAIVLKNKELKSKINNLNNLIDEKDKNIKLLEELEKKKSIVKEEVKDLEKKEEVKDLKQEKEIIKEDIKQEEVKEEKVNLYSNTSFKPSSIVPSPIGLPKEEVKEMVDNKQLEIKFEEPKEKIELIEQEDDNKQLEINFNALKEDKKQDNVSFMSEVSKKLEEATAPSTIELTDYEKKQEEEAIISYKELIENKDKLYNITDDEEDFDFIEELKSFRNDL